MMNRSMTTALTALLLVTIVVVPSMLVAADTEEEALRRDFVSPENLAGAVERANGNRRICIFQCGD
jgi:hypothetical protein